MFLDSPLLPGPLPLFPSTTDSLGLSLTASLLWLFPLPRGPQPRHLSASLCISRGHLGGSELTLTQPSGKRGSLSQALSLLKQFASISTKPRATLNRHKGFSSQRPKCEEQLHPSAFYFLPPVWAVSALEPPLPESWGGEWGT